LDAYFSKYRINPADREYDIIYVNGDNNLENLHTDEDKWKVEMIEKVFNEKMWEA
jgi:adenine-specific DNA-methyltransferase